ncbi:MAG: aminoacyl-tRNA hydrolase [Flavobacteriales bacterium]
MKFLIAGLGNIGNEYDETRHNIGFKILDALAKASNVFFKTERYGELATVKHKGRTYILLKPNTYMNLSGNAVRYWMQKENIPAERTLVIADDLALPFGKLRIRANGSDGGHNGFKNINEVLGNNNYPRLRFGIAAEFSKGKQVDYVLGKWSDEENQKLPERVEIATQAILAFGLVELGKVMSEFNAK